MVLVMVLLEVYTHRRTVRVNNVMSWKATLLLSKKSSNQASNQFELKCMLARCQWIHWTVIHDDCAMCYANISSLSLSSSLAPFSSSNGKNERKFLLYFSEKKNYFWRIFIKFHILIKKYRLIDANAFEIQHDTIPAFEIFNQKKTLIIEPMRHLSEIITMHVSGWDFRFSTHRKCLKRVTLTPARKYI